MKRQVLLWAALLTAFTMAKIVAADTASGMDCIEGSGVSRQEERTLDAFTGLEVSGVFDIHLSVGSPRQVTLTGDDNILEHIRTEVRNGTLTVDSKRSICIKTDLRLDIRVPEIRSVSAGGNVTLNAEKITGQHFSLTLDGSTNATVQGDCQRFEAALLGATALDADALKADHVTIRLTGAGNASVYASERLDANISGVGTVTYAGNPAQINPVITGVGDLIPR